MADLSPTIVAWLPGPMARRHEQLYLQPLEGTPLAGLRSLTRVGFLSVSFGEGLQTPPFGRPEGSR